MNQLAQFLHYAQKVFDLKIQLRGVHDGRSSPQIPTPAVLITLLLGVVLRFGSYLNLSEQTQRRRWQHLSGLKGPISDDTFEYVTERLWLEDLRQTIAGATKKLKANKALESCKIHGLFFLSLDANEHCKSRSRCCPQCCRREIEETDAQGNKHKVIEYYHRYVFAQISGPKINLLLDVEPIRPGEEECAAALRLLGRLRRIYGVRFFDAISADAWYAKGPFLRAVEKLGWKWIVVLKDQRRDIYQEGLQLSQRQKPSAAFEDEERDRQVELWEVKDLDFSDGYGKKKVRVVRSQERWVQTQILGGKKTRQPQQSQWLWAASGGLDGYPPEVIYQGGHRRWGIENKAFNELTQGYHLEHCYHHEPHSMLAQMLILILGFTLFTAFAQLHSQLLRLGEVSLKELAHKLDLALEEDLPWSQWFHCG